MVWIIEFDGKAKKELKKLPKDARKEIIFFLENKIIDSKNPNLYAKPLVNSKSGLWKLRIGKYRVIYNLEKEKLIIFVLRVGKRDVIYKR